MGSIHIFNKGGTDPAKRGLGGLRFTSAKVAAITSAALLGAVLSSAPAHAIPVAPVNLNATVVATPAAPFIDSVAGTSVGVTISGMTGVTDQDVLYLALLDGAGSVTKRVTVVPGAADADGNVTTGSASFTTLQAGAVNYRVWVDQEDPITGVRNRIYDDGSGLLNEPTTAGVFTFASNPHNLTITDGSGPLPNLVTVNEGTCELFYASVTDISGTPVAQQSLKLTFEADAVGNRPQSCSEAELAPYAPSAATTNLSDGIGTGSTNILGNLIFAIKGVKGAPAWTGQVTAQVVDPKADPEAVAKFDLTTNPGGNNAVATITPTPVPSEAPRLSDTTVPVRVTDKYGHPIQGVKLSISESSAPAAISELLATDMYGNTTAKVDTEVLGMKHYTVWSNKTVPGSTNGLDAGEVLATFDIDIVPQVVDITKSTFVAAVPTVPVDKASDGLTLTINDSVGNAVKDVQVDFAVTKGSNITLDSTFGTTDSAGQVRILASRLPSFKTRDQIEVTATVRDSDPVASITVGFEIQPRAAAQIALISPTQIVSTVDGGLTRVEVALQDQFGGPFQGNVSFRSKAGRNFSATGTQTIATNAEGHAVVYFPDSAGSGVDETDQIIGEALTVEGDTIVSGAVNVSYTPSLAANNMDQTGLPEVYGIKYEDHSVQDLQDVTLTIQNSTGGVARNLYSVPVTVNLSGPAVFADGLSTSINATSNANANVFVGVRPTGVAGVVTLTAVSGGVTKTWYMRVKPDPIGARYITITSSKATALAGDSTRFSVNVKDVYGNNLPSVVVTFQSSGVGRLNTGRAGLVGLMCSDATSDSNYAFNAMTDLSGNAYADLLTTSYDAGVATVTGYIGAPIIGGGMGGLLGPGSGPNCTDYPEVNQLAGAPIDTAAAGNGAAVANVTYSLDTSAADKLAAAQAAAAQAAADKAAAQALADKAAADKAAAQALADKAAADKAAADKAAAQSAADKAAAQAALKQLSKVQVAVKNLLASSKKNLVAAKAKLKAAKALYAKALKLSRSKR